MIHTSTLLSISRSNEIKATCSEEWAPTAKAHCPNHQHCDGGEPPPLGPLVVRDSTGKLIGQVLDFTGREVRGNGIVEVVVQMEVAGDPRIFLIRVKEAGYIEGPSGVWSEDDICGDPIYKRLEAALSNLELAFVQDGIAYISEADSAPETILADSLLPGEDGVCNNIAPVLITAVFPTVSVDLDAAFTPPFSAGF